MVEYDRDMMRMKLRQEVEAMAKKEADREAAGPDRFAIHRQPLAVFRADDLPNMASHRDQSECGFSLYRGVLVQWDEDYNTRVLTFVDEMTEAERRELMVVQEHEGCIEFIWRSTIPSRLATGCNIDVCGDVWFVGESKRVIICVNY